MVGGDVPCEPSPQASETGGRLAPCTSPSSLPLVGLVERETRPAATAYTSPPGPTTPRIQPDARERLPRAVADRHSTSDLGFPVLDVAAA